MHVFVKNTLYYRSTRKNYSYAVIPVSPYNSFESLVSFEASIKEKQQQQQTKTKVTKKNDIKRGKTKKKKQVEPLG